MEGAITLTVTGGYGGLTKTWLDEYAAEAEKTRLDLIHCQKFVADTWALSGQ